jgi:hypoxanthine phosphoribosyltransferase
MDYSYADFEKGVLSICSQIRHSEIKFDYIVGVARGGAIPAVRISHKLNIPCVIMNWNTREERLIKESPVVLDTPIREGKEILLMDDIIDDGKTMTSILSCWNLFTNNLKHVKIGALIWNQSQDIKCDFYHKAINRTIQKDWVNFWWEK